MSLKFMVINCDASYNMIYGRPWIQNMGVVPSNLHQVVKFPIPWGIIKIKRVRKKSRSFYKKTLKGKISIL